jgi:hypothetical protein
MAPTLKTLRPLCFAAALAFSSTCFAAEQVLYEIPLEMNRNDEADRAMLVIVGDTINIEEAKPLDFYQLEQGQRADLLIFLDVGDDALNVTDTPSIRKQGIAVFDSLRFVMPQETNAKGSLNIITSNGFGNTFNTTETLTVVYRDKHFIVAGIATDVYAQGEDAHCSINFLSGKAMIRRLDDSKNMPLKGSFKQTFTLDDWSQDTRPTACDALAD